MKKDLLPEKLDIGGESHFLNYELSVLNFNWRVLREAFREKNPLLERVKFIGIVCSNLDEFFQKRVGGLKRQLHAGVQEAAVDGLTPLEQLKAIRSEVKDMIAVYRDGFFLELIPLLQEEGIVFKEYGELEPQQKRTIDDYFNRQLYPLITPLAVDEGHPFPFISNKSRSFALELVNPSDGEKYFARIKIPMNRPRWLQAGREGDKTVLVSIDDVIREHIDRFFPGMEIVSAHVFRVTRNADLERNEEEADDLLENIEEELRERRFAEIVRLEIDHQTPHHIKEYLIEHMDISWADVYEIKGPLGLADVFELHGLEGYGYLCYEKWTPTLHPVFRHEMDEEAPGIFDVIRKEEFLVHHPYHSFASSTQRFIDEAVKDPKVLAIKQTLYRTSSDSPIMHALMRAAEMGKQVAILVELKARFDEERNISWAQKLEKAGAHVAYGMAGLKIHTKLTVVVREEEEGLRRYVHIGTGNYHPETSRYYEDLGFFTCDEIIGSDVSDLFNLLTGFAPDQHYSKLVVAPKYMRDKLMSLIEYEMQEARAGREGRITAKMNNLEDPLIIQALYEASQAGVKIALVVRSVCRLIPQKKGLSENIRIYSIVGRFLEHSRVYNFHHGGEDLFFIGSADWMHRNLDARIEALVPIQNRQLKEYLRFVLEIYFKDNEQRWELGSDGSYKRVEPEEEAPVIGVNRELMKHAMLLQEPIPRGNVKIEYPV